MKVIIDTNVLFSALAFGGIPLLAVEACFTPENRCKVYSSQETLDEIKKELCSEQFMKYSKYSPEHIYFLLDQYKKETIIIASSKKINVSQDPDDNKFLEIADAIQAHYLITGDKDLLTLEEYKKTLILKPSRFLEKMRNVR